jgi:hypothetical protein
VARRLYVAKDENLTVVSRGRVRMGGAQRVVRPWGVLVERASGSARGERASGPVPGERAAASPDQVAAPQERTTGPGRQRKSRALASLADAAFVVVPPVLAGSVTATFAPVEAGFAVGGCLLLATSALAQPLRRRLASRGPRAGGHETRVLTSERAAFHRAINLAERISETWPALGSMVDITDAERTLSEALWEIADLLSRRQTLTGILADLSRPEFAAQPSGELTAQLRATKEALSEMDADLARREASLRRADEAGREFLREQDMRQAIRAAEDELTTPVSLSDAGTHLADQTRSVLEAYRELTR